MSITAVTGVLEEKMPKSAWHSEKVDGLKGLLKAELQAKFRGI